MFYLVDITSAILGNSDAGIIVVIHEGLVVDFLTIQVHPRG